MDANGTSLSNSKIAELLALAADEAKMPLQKALRRASRKAFLWPEEVIVLVEKGESLTELPGVGPGFELDYSGLDRSTAEDVDTARSSEIISHPAPSTCRFSQETFLERWFKRRPANAHAVE